MKPDNSSERRHGKNKELRTLVSKANKICMSFFNEEYRYSDAEAIEELGVDKELVNQLVEDYVNQILKAIVQFEEMIYKLQETKDAKLEPDFSELRDLAHKNLGVARNLRIKDAETLLHDLMKKDDLEHLFRCTEALQACTIRLKPECASAAIRLIEVKSSFISS